VVAIAAAVAMGLLLQQARQQEMRP